MGAILNTELSNMVLRDVAMHSHKVWAEQIYIRNKTALDQLQLWHKQITEDPKTEVNICDAIPYGCPHCDGMRCRFCIWNGVVRTYSAEHAYVDYGDTYFTPEHRPCCAVLFNEVAHVDVCDQEIVSLSYSASNAYIRVKYQPGPSQMSQHAAYARYKQEYDNVVAFLQGHMDWTKWECWGQLIYKDGVDIECITL